MNDAPGPPRGEVDDDGRPVSPYVREEGTDGSVKDTEDLTAEQRSDISRVAFHAMEGLADALTPAGCMWMIYHLVLRVFPGANFAEHSPEQADALHDALAAADPFEDFLDFQRLHEGRLLLIYEQVREMSAICPGCGRVHGPDEAHGEGEKPFQPGAYVNKVSGESLRVIRVEASRVVCVVQVSEDKEIQRVYERGWAEENLVPGDSVEVLTQDLEP